MEIVEHEIIVAHLVHGFPCKLIPKQRWIALNKGVESLFRDQIARDALNLLRRAAVQRRKRNGGADARRDRVDVLGIYLVETREVFLRPSLAFLPDRGGGGILEPFDEPVDLFARDSLKVVADAHVEHESVRTTKIEFPADQLERKPGFHILVKRLRNAQLRGPLDVVALVLGEDAGLADGQVLSIERLHRFQFEESASGIVSGYQVLCKLRMRAGGGAERRFQMLRKELQRVVLRCDIGTANTKYAALLALFQNPVHQIGKRNWRHTVGHRGGLLFRSNSAGTIAILNIDYY